jgi:alkane 1-monooxygenase
LGEGYWRFLARTLAGSLAHAWALDRRDVAASWAATLAVAAALGAAFGPLAVAFFFGQSAMAVALLEAVNYVEHYGLQREKLRDGRYERQGAHHAWDAYGRRQLLPRALAAPRRPPPEPSRPYAALRRSRRPAMPMGCRHDLRSAAAVVRGLDACRHGQSAA